MMAKLAYEKAPHLLNEFVKNVTNPEKPFIQSTHGSVDRCVWECDTCQYVWEARIDSRVGQGRGCPRCSGQVVSATSSFVINFPNLVLDYDIQSNPPIDLLTQYSSKHINWVCHRCSFSWTTKLNGRTKKNSSCPNCTKDRFKTMNLKTQFEGSLLDLFPDIAVEFVENKTRPGRSIGQTPSMSSDRCVWKCIDGHVWEAPVYNRTRGRSCFRCTKWNESKFEHHVSKLVTQMTGLNVAVNNLIVLNHKTEYIDLFIDELDAYIDLDPDYWHKNIKDRDQRKLDRCKSIQFFKVREENSPDLVGNCVKVAFYSPLLFSLGICEMLGIEPAHIPDNRELKEIFIFVENELRNKK